MQAGSPKKLKALICQTHPQLNQKQKNIKRFETLIQKFTHQDRIDIVIFPEMSFTGYNFSNKEEIMPLAVQCGQGQEFQYARSLSLRLKAFVLFGYVEKIDKDGKIVLYNSAAVSNREGQFIFNTRKSHLYYADQFWAEEGEGFKTLEISNLQGDRFKCGVGICMDINPKGFTSGKFQFADFIKEQECDVMLFPTNWIDHDRSSSKSSVQIFNYWLSRLEPLLKGGARRRYLLVADRVGQEYSFYDKKDQHFIGSSCVLSINPHQLVGKHLDKDCQDYILTQICLPKS